MAAKKKVSESFCADLRDEVLDTIDDGLLHLKSNMSKQEALDFLVDLADDLQGRIYALEEDIDIEIEKHKKLSVVKGKAKR